MKERHSETNIKAMFADKFYPGDKVKLNDQLNSLFEEVKTPSQESSRIQALISPHAGYIFSGEIAASAFNQIPKNAQYKRVFVLASSHQSLFNGASVYCDGNYNTPLGEIKIDTEFGEKLVQSSTYFTNYPEAYINEHSLEVQLPFLQYKLGDNFLLVPIIIGTNKEFVCKELAQILKPYFTPENLFIISSDFSHYPNYKEANHNDKRTATAICSNNPNELLQVLKENNKRKINNLATSLCGWTSVLTLLHITENEDFSYHEICYQNSGDARFYGDKSRVVGYWAISVQKNTNSFVISTEEKKEVLKIARLSIKTFLEKGKRGKAIKSVSKGILDEKTGCFVSIYVDDELRGCIGGFAQENTLNEMVQKMAVSASCDGRFENIKREEVDNMELEISILSPLKKIKSIDEIELGKHGIYIRQNYNSGTFLPQVANKTGWNKKQFLGHCSRDKAGIGWDGWKTADVYTYEAIVFRGT